MDGENVGVLIYDVISVTCDDDIDDRLIEDPAEAYLHNIHVFYHRAIS